MFTKEEKASNHHLFPFQREAVNASVKSLVKYGAVFNASEPGVGKTIMTCGVLNRMHKTKPTLYTLVVCPTSMLYTWQAEIERWTNLKTFIIKAGNAIPKTFESGVVYIMTYGLIKLATNMRKFSASMGGNHFDMVIFDECHILKSMTSNVTKAIYNIVSKLKWFKYKIFLSGTPYINCSNDAFPVYQMCSFKLFPSYSAFSKKYANYVEQVIRVRGKTIVKPTYRGVQNETELNKILRESFFIRYLLADVSAMGQMPELISKNIYLPKECSPEISDELKEEIKSVIEETSNPDALPAVAAFRINSAKRKLLYVADYVQEILEQNRTVIIFAHHKEIIAEYAKELAYFEPLCITGDTPAKRRTDIVSDVQNGYCKLLIMNMTAGGIGITVTAASDVVYAEFPWTYTDYSQSLARAYRSGQKQNVIAHNFLVKGSIDESIFNLVLHKKEMHNKLMN